MAPGRTRDRNEKKKETARQLFDWSILEDRVSVCGDMIHERHHLLGKPLHFFLLWTELQQK